MALRRNKKSKEIAKAAGYDYSSKEARERTAMTLFGKARDCRSPNEREWETYNDYYNFLHDAAKEMQESYEETGLDYVPPCVPDPFVMVETQIVTEAPEPEFRGRDDDQDSKKAKQREYAVKFVCENNRLCDMVTPNERRVVKYGDAFWKVYWDNDMRTGIDEGDIRIEDIPIESLYVDPAAREKGLQAAQFIDHVYRMHKVAFCAKYAPELRAIGISPEELMTNAEDDGLKLFDMTYGVNDDEDTVTVVEHWFKHPFDSDGAQAGDVGCSILVGWHEIKYIPCYWQNTRLQNKRFPFEQMWRIRDENSFYNKSELFPILPLVDTADRILGMGIANQAMVSNDIFVTEENALADGQEIDNSPGAVITMKAGKINSIRRLGGIQPLTEMQASINWVLEQIQRANRNYETNQGKEAARATTATALSMMRQDAQAQDAIKAADRNAGYERLYELIDWSVLEFYDTDRLIWIGAKDENEDNVNFLFNSANVASEMPAVEDMLTGEVVRESWTYYPRVDVTVSAGDNIVKGKQATLSALEGIAQMNVNETNWRIVAAELEVLDLPQRQEIIDGWRMRFERPPMPEMPAQPTQTPVPGVDAAFPEYVPEMAGGASPAPTAEMEALPYEM